jgi:hypothetical protein
MTQLTEERFEEILTEKLSPLATKEQIEDLARMTSRGFEDVLERLDVRERMAARGAESTAHRYGTSHHASKVKPRRAASTNGTALFLCSQSGRNAQRRHFALRKEKCSDDGGAGR